MQIKAEEISAIIKEKIKGFDKQVDVKETVPSSRLETALPRSMDSMELWPGKCSSSLAASTGLR